jgi:hypothetical protein
MMKHEDLDFPHAADWCDECSQKKTALDTLDEMKKQSKLRERQIVLQEMELDIGPQDPPPRRIYMSAPQPKPSEQAPKPKQEEPISDKPRNWEAN